MQYIIYTFIFLIIIAIIIALIYFILHKIEHKAHKELDLNIILIQIPKYTSSEEEKLSKEYIVGILGRIENFFASLSGLKAEKKTFGKRSDVFSLEIVSENGFINFYAAVPKKFQDFFIQQLQAVYPEVYFEIVTDYNLFKPKSQISAGLLNFNADFSLPIKTYKTFENDPLESITNSLSKLQENESAAVQYVFRSAPKAWHSRGKKIAKNIHKGMSFKKAVAKVGGIGDLSAIGKVFSVFLSFFITEEKSSDPSSDTYSLSSMEQEQAKGLEEKTSKSALEVNIRIVTSSLSIERSNSILTDILNSYTQYNVYEYGNSFKAHIPKNINDVIYHFIYRNYISKYKLILNSEEMVSVMHLPLPTTDTPNINWLQAVKLPPPSTMPKEGLLLGMNTYRGKETKVYIKEKDRFRHIYEIGQTGTGKSVFMESLIKQDIENGKGVCVIDPHGDLVEKMLTHVPKERAEDVIVFDPSDTERPLGINMLEYEDDEQKTFVINEVLNIFDKLYDLKATGGPMFEKYMRSSMLLIMDDKDNPASLLEIPTVLADEEYRNRKLAKTTNYLVKDFWQKEATQTTGDQSLANMVPYITSKLTPFISSDILRPIISQQKSAFNFREAMDTNKIILVNLSKGKIGELSSNLLGMIIIGKLLFAAMSRVDIPEDERESFYLYIDEFQNFMTDSIASILSEARKYKLSLTVAHQYVNQLSEGGDTSIRDAIFGNVGTMVSYRIGIDDAEVISEQMAPTVSKYDLLNMPKYTCYIKLLIDNQNPPAFNFNPIMPEKGNYELAKAIKELSRMKYGKDRTTLEREIKQRLVI